MFVPLTIAIPSASLSHIAVPFIMLLEEVQPHVSRAELVLVAVQKFDELPKRLDGAKHALRKEHRRRADSRSKFAERVPQACGL